MAQQMGAVTVGNRSDLSGIEVVINESSLLIRAEVIDIARERVGYW